MTAITHLTMAELEAGLDDIRQSPPDEGRLEWIVRRPRTNEREVLDQGQLDVTEGLVGDNWLTRGNSRTEDGSAHPDMQLNVMNARVIDLLAQDKACWQFVTLHLLKNQEESILSSAERSGARIEGCGERERSWPTRTLRYGFRYATTYSGC